MPTPPEVVGTDGHVPIREPDGTPWRFWNKNQLYTGGPAQGRYVGKVNDYAKDVLANVDYRIVDIDLTTQIPTFVEMRPPYDSGNLDDGDLLQGVGTASVDTFRVYIDKSVMPHVMSVERRYKVPGQDAVSCKIFRGSELTSNQKVISAFYDQSGNLLGQDIPLELVQMDNSEGTNVSVKIVPTCYTTEDLPNDEIVTAVFYSAIGNVVSKRQLLVENTAFIASANTSAKYVTDISIDSPFVSSSDATLLLFPLNVLVSNLNLFGVVHYSDGSTLRLPVDGNKFRIDGLDPYITTVVSQETDLVLTYQFSPNELFYGGSVGAGRHKSIDLRARTLEVDGSYSPKLFGYPVWIDAANGYRLEWWLANLERSAIFNATPYVTINANTNAFDPTAYGTFQRLSVSVDLAQVNPSLGHYIHTQVMDVVLLTPGTDRSATGNWTVAFDPGQPVYGKNHAVANMVNANSWRVQIDQGITDYDTWLERLYYRVRPLYDTDRESKAPMPTHFAFVFNDRTIEFPMNQWQSQLTLSHALTNSGTLYVKFIKRTSDNDLELATVGLAIWQV